MSVGVRVFVVGGVIVEVTIRQKLALLGVVEGSAGVEEGGAGVEEGGAGVEDAVGGWIGSPAQPASRMRTRQHVSRTDFFMGFSLGGKKISRYSVL